MQTISRKKVAIGALTAGLIALGVLYVTNRQGTKPRSVFVNPAFGEYIAAYTTGVIGSGSTIQIMLSDDVADSAEVGQEATHELFSFKPSLHGRTVWLDRRTLEFKPDARLLSGQPYEVRFNLAYLMKVPKELSYFEYTIQVLPQNFEVSIENVKSYDKTALNRQKIEGVLATADFAKPDAIEAMLKAQQEGKSLNVTWTHTAEGRQHAFTIDDVVRNDAASTVKLTADGEALGVGSIYRAGN